jgi:hypothetical protein
MMHNKKITINFFQLCPEVESEEEKIAGNQELVKLFENIPTNFQSIVYDDSKVNLFDNLKNKRGLVLGTLIRNQISDIPPKYNDVSRSIEPLDLTHDQGLGYATCFLYDPSLRILVIESIRNGVGIATLCAFLEKNFNLTNKIEPNFVINPTDLARFYDMGSIKKFEVKIARIHGGSIFNQKKKSINQITNAADQTDTDLLEYSLSVNRGHDTLSLSTIRNFVSSLLKFKGSDEVKAMKVTGKSFDSTTNDTIDFIKEKMVDSIFVERVRVVTSFNIEDHYDKLIDVYHKHKKSLQVYKKQ